MSSSTQEICLYSDKYRVAGRADCIANYQHQLSVIDFKTSTNERKDSYNENYYIQTATYALMFEEITGQPINQIVILVVTEKGTVQEFIKDKKDYIPLLEETLDEWITKHIQMTFYKTVRWSSNQVQKSDFIK